MEDPQKRMKIGSPSKHTLPHHFTSWVVLYILTLFVIIVVLIPCKPKWFFVLFCTVLSSIQCCTGTDKYIIVGSVAEFSFINYYYPRALFSIFALFIIDCVFIFNIIKKKTLCSATGLWLKILCVIFCGSLNKNPTGAIKKHFRTILKSNDLNTCLLFFLVCL